MDNGMFRKLTSEEENKFRNWAKENYIPGNEINELWHPVVKAECEKINQKVKDIP